MIQNYVPSEWKTDTYYRAEFFVDRSGGLSFPCDENGKILDSLNPYAKKNYEDAMQHPEKYPYCFNAVTKYEQDYKEPAHGTCSCGEEIELVNEYMGACQCPKCGQWYNLFGQELLPPAKWEE